MAKAKKRGLAVIDFETDPFLHGRVPRPFCAEFYTDKITEVFWGDDCAERLYTFLCSLPDDYLIYAHNGGKFDFHFLHEYIANPVLIIKSRIVKCKLAQHEMRDSYAILPMPLKGYKKQEFDYRKMERPVREKHKDEILDYLHSDCVYLYELVSAFVDRFGPKLTIGGTAIKEIERLHPFKRSGAAHDERFRQYYFGGRVQCFKAGIHKGPWRSYDVNSMYPSVMRNRKHPANGAFDRVHSMPDNFDLPYFLHFQGRNKGAIPTKLDDGGLSFLKTEGEFFACSHEIEVALEHGLIDITKVIDCWIGCEPISFGEFVDINYADKSHCKEIGDHIGEIFAKFLLNSGYGRYGINPENFQDWLIFRDYGREDELYEQGYERICEFPDFELWAKPAAVRDTSYCDVAIAASITSGSRAELLDGLQRADDPAYCDTDCIICRDFDGEIDKYRLGAWDLEKTSDEIVIAGKKLYAMFNRKGRKLETVKLSSKGGTLELRDLIALSKGDTVTYHNDAPTFSLRKSPTFVTRNFRMTVDVEDEYAYS